MLSTFIKNALHVLLAGLLSSGTGLSLLLATYIPTTFLSGIGITVNSTVLAMAILTGLQKIAEHKLTGGK